MKVLVTGGCGFIGVHACEFFCRQGWAVIAYDNMTKFELDRTGYRADAARDYNWNWLGELGVEKVIGDIRDLEQILIVPQGATLSFIPLHSRRSLLASRSRWLI